MERSASNSGNKSLTCAACKDVCTASKCLPCHHRLCRTCLGKLSKRYQNLIACPVCRRLAPLPPDDVCDLQANFRLAAEAMERARSAECSPLCPSHPEDRVRFYCTQCEQVICTRCKATKHEGHVTEDFSSAVTRCKKRIAGKLEDLHFQIRYVRKACERFKGKEDAARNEQAALAMQIHAQYDSIVGMATKYRDEALQKLQEMSGKDVSSDTKYLDEDLKHLLLLQKRAQLALSGACDMEVLEVDKTLRQRRENVWLQLEVTSTPPVARNHHMCHRGIQTKNILDNMKFFGGSPVYWF